MSENDRLFPMRFVRLLPREHGFWVMISAVLGYSVFHAGAGLQVLLVAVGCLVGVSILGSVLHRRLRRGPGQVAAAASLSLAGLPVTALGGVPLVDSLLAVLVWASLFSSSALVVRAAIARSRRDQHQAVRLSALAVSVCLMTSCAFWVFSARTEAIATLLGALGCSVLVLIRPTAKQMKPVGLALAGLATATMLTLMSFPP